MALVTGTLTDFGLDPKSTTRPVITFTPSGPATVAQRLLMTQPVRVTPNAAGNFDVDLIATRSLVPTTWYTIKIAWLDANAGYQAVDFVSWKLIVPPEGGEIGELIAVPSDGDIVWIGTTAPAENSTHYSLWIDTSSIPPLLKRMEG